MGNFNSGVIVIYAECWWDILGHKKSKGGMTNDLLRLWDVGEGVGDASWNAFVISTHRGQDGNRKGQRENTVLSPPPEVLSLKYEQPGCPRTIRAWVWAVPGKEVVNSCEPVFSSSVQFLGRSLSAVLSVIGVGCLVLQCCLHGGHVTRRWPNVNPWGKLNLGSNLNFKSSFLPYEGSV